MFKDVFTLKKSSYHAKMMKWIWNLDCTDFTHMCPYWWLSVFNHIIFIPYFTVRKGWWLIVTIFYCLYKSIEIPVSAVYKKYEAHIETMRVRNEIRREQRESEIRAKERKEWEGKIQYYKEHPEELVSDNKVNDGIIERLRQWHYSDWQEIQKKVWQVEQALQNTKLAELAEKKKKEALEELGRVKNVFIRKYKGADKQALLDRGANLTEILFQMEEAKKATEKERQRQIMIATKNRINAILRIVKPIMTACAYVLGSLLVIVVLYYGFVFGKHTVHYFTTIKPSTWKTVGKASKISGWVSLALVILAVIMVGIFRLAKYIEEKETIRRRKRYSYDYIPKSKSKFWKHIGKCLLTIPNSMIWVFDNILEPFFKIIAKIFRAIKNAAYFVIQMLKSNCPAIKWEE